MFLHATYLAIFVVAAAADESDDCSLKCLGESRGLAWSSAAKKSRGGLKDDTIGPSARNMTCASEKNLADCMDKCMSIAVTNATCTASPAFRDTHSVVCGSDIVEEAQNRFWEHAYNFSAEWARTQQNQCPTFKNHTIEEICETIHNCTFGEALRSAQLEIMPSPYIIQDEVAAVKLSIYSHLHAKYGDLPERCDLLSQFSPVAPSPNHTEPNIMPTDADKCALQCIYPVLGKEWFLGVKKLLDPIGAAQLDAVTPLTSCNSSAEYVACLKECPHNQAIESAIAVSESMNGRICSPTIAEEVQQEYWRQSLAFADYWYKKQQYSPRCPNCSIELICKNTEEYVFGDALEEVQRREQTPPDATHYQVTLVKLLFYTKYHVQYGELPQSCDFLKGKVPETEDNSVNGIEQCSIHPPWKVSSGTENSLLSLLA